MATCMVYVDAFQVPFFARILHSLCMDVPISLLMENLHLTTCYMHRF